MRLRLLVLLSLAVGWVAHDYLGHRSLTPTVHLVLLLFLAYRLGRGSSDVERALQDTRP
jgi:uncharacterized membrane protein YbjE (DUF340 family)